MKTLIAAGRAGFDQEGVPKDLMKTSGHEPAGPETCSVPKTIDSFRLRCGAGRLNMSAAVLISVFVLLTFLGSRPAQALAAAPWDLLPPDYRASTTAVSFAQTEAFLKAADGRDPVSVSIEGVSAAGRPLYLVHLGRGKGKWRILFYAQQHGDEVAGKDALLYLIRDIARDPALLPADVDLWIMPVINPDGALAGTRRSAAGADLNRDHLSLEQPETQTLHRAARRLRPHVAVDCHEFAGDRGDKSWRAWPVITMDSLNTPLFDARTRARAMGWVESISVLLKRSGRPFLRYWVGGNPPDEEQRHSAPDIDGGLNGLGLYGGFSFIVESNSAMPLGERVDAYSAIFRSILSGGLRAHGDLAALDRPDREALGAFIPTNYLWVNPDARITLFPVIEAATGRTLEIPTPNMMTELAVKKSVPAPDAYAVPAPAAGVFAALLERHGISFEVLASSRTVLAELSLLERVEDQFDEVYSRYEGRQIVKRRPPSGLELPSGSLLVTLRGEDAVRAALVLEPSQLYGLYQYPRYKALVGPDGICPVWRLVK